MKNRRRIERLTERLQARDPNAGPLTLFLVEADTEHPVGTRIL